MTNMAKRSTRRYEVSLMKVRRRNFEQALGVESEIRMG